jgi:hypothetical protein
MQYQHDQEGRSKGGYRLPVNYFRCAEGCVNLKFDGVAAVDSALLLRWVQSSSSSVTDNGIEIDL